MISLSQLAEISDTDRLEVITRLQAIADEYGLSYTVTEDVMQITLPEYSEASSPVVGRVAVAIDDIEAPDSVGGD